MLCSDKQGRTVRKSEYLLTAKVRSTKCLLIYEDPNWDSLYVRNFNKKLKGRATVLRSRYLSTRTVRSSKGLMIYEDSDVDIFCLFRISILGLSSSFCGDSLPSSPRGASLALMLDPASKLTENGSKLFSTARKQNAHSGDKKKKHRVNTGSPSMSLVWECPLSEAGEGRGVLNLLQRGDVLLF